MTQKKQPIVDIATVMAHPGLRALAIWFAKQVHQKAERSGDYQKALFQVAKRGAFSPKFRPNWERLGGLTRRTEDGRYLPNQQIGVFMSLGSQLQRSPEVVGEAAPSEPVETDPHQLELDEAFLATLSPLRRVHTRLRARSEDIAAAINPDDVDPVLEARLSENLWVTRQIEIELKLEKEQQ
jgi:hypothetical protein